MFGPVEGGILLIETVASVWPGHRAIEMTQLQRGVVVRS